MAYKCPRCGLIFDEGDVCPLCGLSKDAIFDPRNPSPISKDELLRLRKSVNDIWFTHDFPNKNPQVVFDSILKWLDFEGEKIVETKQYEELQAIHGARLSDTIYDRDATKRLFFDIEKKEDGSTVTVFMALQEPGEKPSNKHRYEKWVSDWGGLAQEIWTFVDTGLAKGEDGKLTKPVGKRYLSIAEILFSLSILFLTIFTYAAAAILWGDQASAYRLAYSIIALVIGYGLIYMMMRISLRMWSHRRFRTKEIRILRRGRFVFGLFLNVAGVALVYTLDPILGLTFGPLFALTGLVIIGDSLYSAKDEANS
jgi:hypothetical protein